MPDLDLQWPGLAGVIAALLIGPGAAIGFLLWQQTKRRAERRSAFDRRMLRSPGHSVREQLDDARTDVAWSILWLATWPMLVLSAYLVHVMAAPNDAAWWPFYALVAFGLVAFQVFKLARLGRSLDHLRSGYDADVVAGQELDLLMREGAHVFHDLPCEGFHIDHVVVSAEGFFAVETQGVTKPANIKGRAATVIFDGSSLRFPTWSTEAPLEQVHRQAQWLAKWCATAVGEPISAAPVLSLPGWYVDRVGDGPVRVLSGRELRSLLHVDHADRLAPQLVQRIAIQLEQRCRDHRPDEGQTRADVM